MSARATLSRAWTYARAGYLLRRSRSAATEPRRAAAHRALGELLGQARGVATKIGQAAASSFESAPALTYGQPGLPWPAIARQIEASLGGPHERVFARLDHDSIGASLGQVHRAKLVDGTEVAVKVRYPDAPRAVRAELQLASWMPAAGPVRAWGMDLGGYKELLRQQLGEELDYLGEAARQRRYRADVAVPGLVIPRVVDDLCREDLLVQSWEEGETLEAAVGWPAPDRLALGQIVLRTFMRSIFGCGAVHADPHAGNYRFRRDPRPEFVLYDFGAVLSLDAPRRRALLRLLLALREEEADLVGPCLVAFGFDPHKVELLGPQAIEACRILLEPWLEDRPFAAGEWEIRHRVEAVLGESRWAFRSAAPVDALLLVRALSGLVHIVALLDVRFPWWPFVRECLGDDALKDLRSWRPQQPELGNGGEAPGSARWLRILVESEGQEPFRCALPARDALSLVTMTPADVRLALELSGVRLAEIERQLRTDGLRPRELFDVEVEGKRYRLWLEGQP